MLRARSFALAAADALGRLAVVLGKYFSVEKSGAPIVIAHFGIHTGKEVGNGDVLGAAVRAVAACRARDEAHGTKNIPHLPDRLHLRLVKGPEVLHIREVILHLRHVAHAGEHHEHPLKPRGKADGVACGTRRSEAGIDRLGVLWQVDKVPALDGLHDDDGLVVLSAHFIALSGLNSGILVVEIIELDLHDLDLRILGQNTFQHLRRVMEGNPDMPDLSLLFQVERRLIGAAAPELFKIFTRLRVHQIEVEILHAACLELALKEGTDVLLFLEIGLGQFVGENERLARMALDEAVAQRRLALARKIAVRRIEVVEALGQEGVDHALELRVIDLAPLHRQAHAAEAEIFMYVFKHPLSSLCFCRLFHAAQRVERAGIADIRQTLGHDVDQKRLVVPDAQVCLGVGNELRLAPALRRQEAERDHLAPAQIQPRTRIVVAEAVAHKPLVDVPRLLGAAACKPAHALAEDVDLRLFAPFEAVFKCRGRLSLQGQRNTTRCKDLVGRLQEGKYPPDAEVCRRLIDGLLDLDGRHAHLQRRGHDGAELVDALTAEERCEDGEEARLVVQLAFCDDFVKGEVIKPFDELGIGRRKLRRMPREHPLVIGFCSLRYVHSFLLVIFSTRSTGRRM